MSAEDAVRLAVRLFARLPEPPLYRRRNDPSRETASALLDDATDVLAALYAVEAEGSAPFTRAVELHLEALSFTSAGEVEAAQRPWLEAVAVERRAVAQARGWPGAGRGLRPVYEGGVSRYDATNDAVLSAALPCPGCRQVSEHLCSAAGSPEPLRCPRCGAHFSAYVAGVRGVEVTREGRARRYFFRLEPLSGGARARLEVVDANREPIDIGPSDTVAFVYTASLELRGVVDLTSKRVWWLVPPGACFVATVVFGPAAPELDVLRGFRDEVLERSAAGRRVVDGYYRHGPSWAARVQRHRWATFVLRGALSLVVWGLRRASRAGHLSLEGRHGP